MIETLLYIVICLLTGFCGRDTRIGIFGTFLLALVTTPLLVLPVLILLSSRSADRNHRQVWRA
jgi:uncharacterized membrane protein YbaN (DUF454 family)